MAKMKEEDLVRKFRRDAKETKDLLTPWHEDARQSFAYVASDQWQKEDRVALKSQQRPTLSFNHLHKLVQVVSGSETTNRFEPRYERVGLEPQDQGVSDVYNQFVRHQRRIAYSRQEDGAAFRDMIQVGVGVTEQYLDTDINPGGTIFSVRVPVNEVAWDPYARRQNLEDARYVYRGKWVPLEQFRELFPDKATEWVQASGAGASSIMDSSPSRPLEDASFNWMYIHNPRDSYRADRREVLLIDYQWMQREDALIYRNPISGLLDHTWNDQFENVRMGFLEQGGQDIAQTVLEGSRPRYYRAFLAGNTVLSQEPIATTRGYYYSFMTGFEDQSVSSSYPVYYGLCRILKDPQDWANKILSQLAHVVQTNPKGTLLYAPGTFRNPVEAARQWAQPGGFIQTNSGNIEDRVKWIKPEPVPRSMLDLVGYASSVMPDLVGVNMNYFGGQTADLKRTASTAVDSVLRQSQMVLSPLFDSFSRYRYAVGYKYQDMIRAFIDPAQLVRIAGQGAAQWVPLTYEALNAHYDVIIDEGPSFTTSPLELWQTLTEQGGLVQMIQMGFFPPQLLPVLYPGLQQEHRDMWSQWIEQMMQQQQQAAAAGPQPEAA